MFVSTLHYVTPCKTFLLAYSERGFVLADVKRVLIKITDKTGFTMFVSSLMYSSGLVCNVRLGTV